LTGGQGGGVGGKASGKDPRAEWSRERVIFVADESLEGGRDREKVSDREIRGKDGGRERSRWVWEIKWERESDEG
jgi:hypothetical protein